MNEDIYWPVDATGREDAAKGEHAGERARSRSLLHAVMAAEGMPLREPRSDSKDAVPDGLDFLIALGSAADAALNDLHTLSIDRIRNAGVVRSSGFGLGTLVLLLPDLAWDCFATPVGDGHYKREGLVLNYVARIIVLACPADTGLSKAEHPRVLGRDGAKAGVHEKVQVIDITALLDMPSQALQSALRSCEVIGLMTRLARGMSVTAAIGGGPARIMSPADKDKT